MKAKLDRSRIARIEFRNGVVLESPPELDLNFLLHEIWIDRTYTPVGYEIGDGDRVVDIGGNIGVFTTYAATRARNVSVRAFEPHPMSAALFTSNVEQSGLTNVVLEPVAVAGTAAPRHLHIAAFWGCNSLMDNHGGSTVDTVEVPCTTLDSIITTTGHCDLLKLDCEGAEHEILESASPATLGRIRRIALEYHSVEQGTGDSVKRLLEQRGFRVDVFRAFDSRVGLLCATNLGYRQHG